MKSAPYGEQKPPFSTKNQIPKNQTDDWTFPEIGDLKSGSDSKFIDYNSNRCDQYLCIFDLANFTIKQPTNQNYN